jgi:membrane associated rhomboid family serine protease
VIPLKDDIRTVRFPIVTVALIAANALAFLWQLEVGLDLSVLRGGAIPYELFTLEDVYPPDIVPPPFTILTSMFLHGGWIHLGFNMLTLWIFGNNVEDALGRLRFLAFYLASGVVAAVAQAVASATAGATEVPMVGASGAIAGVLGAYLVLFPYARVLTAIVIVIFVRLVYLPARLFIIGWFVLQVLPILFGGGAGGGVAFFAHIGGFLAGLALVKLMRRRPNWRGRPVSW